MSRVGSSQEIFKSPGSGRVGSGHEVFKMSRVGSGHDPRVGHADLTRGSAFLQTSSCLPDGHSRDPRIRPAGPK